MICAVELLVELWVIYGADVSGARNFRGRLAVNQEY
jgi:hypothetical protein